MWAVAVEARRASRAISDLCSVGLANASIWKKEVQCVFVNKLPESPLLGTLWVGDP